MPSDRASPPVTAAFEVSPDDPQGLAEAIERAAQGDVVHLVRDGQAVADIVPATTAQMSKADRNERALAIERRQAERFGAPDLAALRLGRVVMGDLDLRWAIGRYHSSVIEEHVPDLLHPGL